MQRKGDSYRLAPQCLATGCTRPGLSLQSTSLANHSATRYDHRLRRICCWRPYSSSHSVSATAAAAEAAEAALVVSLEGGRKAQVVVRVAEEIEAVEETGTSHSVV